MVMDAECGNNSCCIGDVKAPQPLQWPNQVIRKTRSDAANAAVSLEDEISRLRQKMEDAFVQYHSLTSEPVMELSRLLDVKINEYMRAMLKGPG